MLTNLYIRNFILIDELNIDFSDGFSVFTGETGAGKSIFIDGISCLIGAKLTTSMIKEGSDTAIIEGVFTLNDTIKRKLSEAGYDTENFIVSRQISRDGKSTVRLNQRVTTLSFIKDCIGNFVDIHCQHDNQYLLNDKYHLSLLDNYSCIKDRLNNLKKYYNDYQQLEKQYDQLSQTTFNQSQLEIIKFQLDELEKLKITDENEDFDLQQQLKSINEIEKNQHTIEQINSLFQDDDGIIGKLYEFSKLADNLKGFDTIQQQIDDIINCYYSICDDFDIIGKSIQQTSIDEQQVEQLNQRLYELQRIKRKYNTSLKGLMDLQNDLNKQIENYDNKDFILNNLAKEKEKAYKKYEEEALSIREIRKTKAKLLDEIIAKELKDLSLPNAQFKTEFYDDKPSDKGLDRVIFMVSMNKGLPLQPLNKTASGGELSRLMLGLKVIFADLQGTELIIFDEIDTGVSGTVALNIGIKMAELAKKIQVFSVTHLSSVAACGKNHYLISKSNDDFTTTSNIHKLTTEERVEQLALMSNASLTANAKTAAEELLKKAQSLCK